MKLKEFNNKVEQIKEKQQIISQIKYSRIKGTYTDIEKLEKEIKETKKEFEKLRVNISYNFGSRYYYEVGYKIGKTYFNTVFMKLSNARHGVEEIPEITKQMQDDMIADSYYY